MHRLMYALMYLLLLSGYLISTADGRGINVFGLFTVPASISGLQNQADIAGELHQWLAYVLIGLTSLHVLAALKHHFVDRDQTLKRMLSSRRSLNRPPAPSPVSSGTRPSRHVLFSSPRILSPTTRC